MTTAKQLRQDFVRRALADVAERVIERYSPREQEDLIEFAIRWADEIAARPDPTPAPPSTSAAPLPMPTPCIPRRGPATAPGRRSNVVSIAMRRAA